MSIPDAPAEDEIIIALGASIGGHPLHRIGDRYQDLKEMGHDALIFSLQEMESLHRDEHFISLEKKYLVSAQKFIFIVPEYNGVFPGILKLMIDNTDIRAVWAGKKVMLTGIATGRSGNLRGLDTLTNICNYIKLHVLPNKIPLSVINLELENGKFHKPETVQSIQTQITEFISFYQILISQLL